MEGRDELRWPVKASLVSTYETMGGAVELSGGAHREGDDFVFPSAGRHGAFRGGVRLLAHEGELDYRVAAPSLGEDADGLFLEVADPAGRGRVLLARLTPVGPASGSAAAALRAVPALTAAGTAVFDGFYPPSTRLDELSVPSLTP